MDGELKEIEELKQSILLDNSQEQLPDYIFVKENSSDEYSDTSSDEEEDEEIDTDKNFYPKESVPFDTTYNEYTLNALEPHLTAEQINVIKSCEDMKLRQLIIVNRFQKLHLNKLFFKYNHLLNEVNKKILNNTIKGLSKHNRVPNNRLAYPYFKNRQSKMCPANADTLNKKQRGELNLNYLSRKKIMFTKMMIDLKSKVMFQYYKNKLREYESKFSIAKGKLSLTGQGEDDVANLKLKCNEFRENFNKMEPPDRFDDTFLDWDLIQGFYSESYTASSCSALWNMLVHPNINRKRFTVEEHNRLIEISTKFNFQNWDAIAKQLNTKRSEYQVCVTMQSSFVRKPYERFTDEEDSQLLEAIQNFRIGGSISWSKVSRKLPSRTKLQCYNRYRILKLMESQELKLGTFSHEEDVLLLCLIKRYGENNFEKIQEHMPHRGLKTLRNHYNESLKVLDDMNMGNWTLQEDEQINKFILANGKKWLQLSKTMVNRTATKIRHRYTVLKRYFDNNYSLSEIPRRQYGLAKFNLKKEQTKIAVEEFLATNVLPKIDVQVERSKSRTFGTKRKRSEIDDQLTDFFRDTSRFSKARQLRAISEEQLNHTANVIQTVLNMLNVTLDIPDIQSIEDPIIDKVDREVLISIKKNKTENHFSNVSPNVNTIQALRCLLLKYQKYRIEFQTCGISGEPDWKSLKHMQSFRKRMLALFRWPCIMSIMEPPSEVVSDITIPKTVYSLPPKKLKGRPKKNNSKIQKMNEAKKQLRMASTIELDPLTLDEPVSSLKIDEPDEITLPPAKNIPDINIIPNHTMETTFQEDCYFEFEDEDVDDPDYMDSTGNELISKAKPSNKSKTIVKHLDQDILCGNKKSIVSRSSVPKSASRLVKSISKPAVLTPVKKPMQQVILKKVPKEVSLQLSLSTKKAASSKVISESVSGKSVRDKKKASVSVKKKNLKPKNVKKCRTAKAKSKGNTINHEVKIEGNSIQSDLVKLIDINTITKMRGFLGEKLPSVDGKTD